MSILDAPIEAPADYAESLLEAQAALKRFEKYASLENWTVARGCIGAVEYHLARLRAFGETKPIKL